RPRKENRLRRHDREVWDCAGSVWTGCRVRFRHPHLVLEAGIDDGLTYRREEERASEGRDVEAGRHCCGMGAIGGGYARSVSLTARQARGASRVALTVEDGCPNSRR